MTHGPVGTVVRRVRIDTPLGPISLASDEDLVSIRPSPLLPPTQRVSPTEILLRMADVPRVEDLGLHGPVVASSANPENASNPELRRYEAKFGRDAFYAAEFLAGVWPQLEEGTVRYFAAYQATETDEQSQAAPGKIANHVRRPDDPLARRLTEETGRRWPWYGGTDTTIQFLSAVCRILHDRPELGDEVIRYPSDHARADEVVARDGQSLTLARAAFDAGRWLVHEVENVRAAPFVWVPMNRRDSFTVWTDSPNAFSDRDGRLPAPPVAPVQVQTQAYDALRSLASAIDRGAVWGHGLDAVHLTSLATRLRTRFLELFIVRDDRGTLLASALERAGGRIRPLASRTVNMGVALDSSLLEGDALRWLRNAIAEQLFTAELRSPFGIAGRSRDDVRFQPFDYHSQVWGFASHKAAKGLARHGYERLAAEIDARVMRQTTDGLFPENVGAGELPALQYCPHILTVRRLAADGKTTVTVKERTPAAYAAWTVAAIIEIDSGLRLAAGAIAEEERILAGLDDRAFQSASNLRWQSRT